MNINQKQYLKKYSNEPKKKKKKPVAASSTVRIIDDDEYFLNDIKHDDDLIYTKEDAPQIVGIIDERPPELIAEDFKNSDKWRGIISEGDNSNQVKHGKLDLSPVRSNKKRRVSASPDLSPKRCSNSLDLSPKRFSNSRDLSPKRVSSNISSKSRTDIKDSFKQRSRVSEKDRRDYSQAKESISIDKRTKNSTDDSQEHEVVRRDRRTGKRITKESTLNEKKEKDKHQEAKTQIYTRWGLGVKQIEAYEQKVQEDHHEMSKPLARFSDDVDLDNHLKNQYRDGDPMLEYIRKAETESKLLSGKPCLPIYKGNFAINRFNIRPGYRWDGVNRSNGYEEKWFEVINKRKATEEQAYRYSTEDM